MDRRTVIAGLAGSAIALGPHRDAEASATAGAWSAVYPWPNVGIHLIVLPNGAVLSIQDHGGPIGDPSTDYTLAQVVRIPANRGPEGATKIDNAKTNLFCAGHAHLPDGRVFVAGGQKVKYYQGADTAVILKHEGGYGWLETGRFMRDPRWYPTVVTLANGEMLVLGGTREGSADQNLIPEVWETNKGGGFRALAGASQSVPMYAWMHVAPNGKVFMSGQGVLGRWLTTGGTGRWERGPSRRLNLARNTGTSVLYKVGKEGGRAVAKVLVLGGGATPTRTAEVIDVAAASPAWRYTGSMAHARRHVNATVLADGTVLVTGGTGGSGNDAGKAVLAAELWDPATGVFKTVARMRTPRLYHSAAVLLPDGRVLVAGGGRTGGASDYKNAEIYSPPYLFKGARPTISSVAARVGYGATFPMLTPDAGAIAKVHAIKLSATTHSFNMGQRLVVLGFAKAAGTLRVTAPPNGNVAPPGHYLLHVVNQTGVPSVGKIIRIG